jgi:hypothetical protein
MTMRVVSAYVSQTFNDKREVEPTLGRVKALPKAMGEVNTLLGNNGYNSQANVKQVVNFAIKFSAHHNNASQS